MTPAAIPHPSRGAARLAAALLPRAAAALKVLPIEERGIALAAIDQFLEAPTPARFLRAARELGQAHRTAALAAAAQPTVDRMFAEGITSLRGVPGIQSEVITQLEAYLPVDPRAGQRLTALALLLGSYEELVGRVVADTEEMRRRMLPSMRRSSSSRRERK
jgi:hypothetical protein